MGKVAEKSSLQIKKNKTDTPISRDKRRRKVSCSLRFATSWFGSVQTSTDEIAVYLGN